MSDYPGGIDSFVSKTDNVDDVMAVDVNELQEAIVAIQTELGVDPAGSATDLKTRLAHTISDAGHLQFDDSTALVIVSGVITKTQNFHRIDTESAAATDILTTINGGAAGDILFLRITSSARTVTIDHNAVNILCGGGADITMTTTADLAICIYDGVLSKWLVGIPSLSAGVTFEDAEGDPTSVDATAAADGSSTYAARRDHRHQLAAHDHSGDAGDGDTFDAANLESGAATDGQVLTADGSGGAAWEDASGGAGDAADLTYTPTTLADWDGAADPGNADSAFDQLAERVKDIEGADREVLTEERIYYVRDDGDDENDGLAEITPFLTIQHAVDVVCNTLDLDVYQVYIDCLGAFAENVTLGELYSSSGYPGACQIISNGAERDDWQLTGGFTYFSSDYKYSIYEIINAEIDINGTSLIDSYGHLYANFSNIDLIGAAGSSIATAIDSRIVLYGIDIGCPALSRGVDVSGLDGIVTIEDMSFSSNCEFSEFLSATELSLIKVNNVIDIGAYTMTGMKFTVGESAVIDASGEDESTIPGDVDGVEETGGEFKKPVLPADAEGYLYNDGAGALSWEDASGGAIALDDITDVNAPAPTAGQVLTWDDVAEEWIADDPPTGGSYSKTEVDILETNFDVENDDSPNNITGLSASLINGSSYKFRAVIFIGLVNTDSENAGFRCCMGGTVTGTVLYTGKFFDQANGYTTTVPDMDGLGTDYKLEASGNFDIMVVEFEGAIVADSSGTLTVQLSQAVSGVKTTSALVGSFLEVIKEGVGVTESHQAIYTIAGDLEVATGKMRLYNRFGTALAITEVHVAVDDPPTGDAAIFDVNMEGTTIFANQAHRPQVAATANEGVTTDIDESEWLDGDYITIDVDNIGSTNPGSDAVVTILCTG